MIYVSVNLAISFSHLAEYSKKDLGIAGTRARRSAIRSGESIFSAKDKSMTLFGSKKSLGLRKISPELNRCLRDRLRPLNSKAYLIFALYSIRNSRFEQN